MGAVWQPARKKAAPTHRGAALSVAWPLESLLRFYSGRVSLVSVGTLSTLLDGSWFSETLFN